jgi:isopenicillin-N epimerase
VTGLDAAPAAAADDKSIANPMWGDDWPQVRALWSHEPGRAHLNHGSFGAVMRSVSAAQDDWRRRLEANPMRFFLAEEQLGVAAARARAATFLGCAADELALVPNATTAASTVLAQLRLRPSDEIVVTDHGYGAVWLAAERFGGAAGATVVTVALDLEASRDDMVATIVDAVSDRTRLVILDHISSATAIVLPVDEVVAALDGSGVAVLVDAAHAPGQVPVDLAGCRADFWTGNFHKWPGSPRGTAALYVGPRWRDTMRPLVASWNEELGFPQSFDLGGTQDLTAWLTLGAALDAAEAVGWDRMRAHGPALAAYGQSVVAEALDVQATDLWGADQLWMRCVPLPAGVATTTHAARGLWARISAELSCEVGVTTWRGRGILRLSAHAYNAPSEYERLATGLRRLFR